MKKIVLASNDLGYKLTESVWATQINDSDLFQLQNIPASVRGYAENDVVRVKTNGVQLEASEITKDSGNGTVWIDFEPSDERTQNAVLDELKSVNCEYERFTKFVVGITVPPSLDVPFNKFIGYLKQEVEKGVIKGWMIAKERVSIDV